MEIKPKHPKIGNIVKLRDHRLVHIKVRKGYTIEVSIEDIEII